MDAAVVVARMHQARLADLRWKRVGGKPIKLPDVEVANELWQLLTMGESVEAIVSFLAYVRHGSPPGVVTTYACMETRA